jgi:hypothetical protein
MSAHLQIDDTGLLEIEDHAGEVWAYRLAPAPLGLARWAVLVTMTSEPDRSYRVALDTGGRWDCTCPAHKYRKRGADPCKHVEHLKVLYAALHAWEGILPRRQSCPKTA